MRFKIKQVVEKINSSSYSKFNSKLQLDENLETLPEKYIHWSNNQTKLLAEYSNLNLNDWIYHNDR